MSVDTVTIVEGAIVGIGALLSAPVLYKGFARRGTGVVYEKNFIIQRAPQYSTLLTVVVVALSFMARIGLITGTTGMVLSLKSVLPETVGTIISWCGIAILLSGMLFMIGGWYSLGEQFTTDAEVLDGHKVRKDGLLKFVMHPAYSGIIQCVLGSAVAALSPVAVSLVLFLVAPLWLNRAKYEEALLLESLGPEYKQYAEEMKWRRLVPKFFPIGV